MSQWDPVLYQSSHSFVWDYGRGVVEWLAPQLGERILDVGCGTGQLTAEIAKAGADVVGIDSSAAMIERARSNFPDLRFEVADATALPFTGEFDAVFSNAVLHWVRDALGAARSMAGALRPGGRLIAEFGGLHNTQAVVDALYGAMAEAGVKDPPAWNPWFYPSIGHYAGILESAGFELRQALLFPRPTKLDPGEEAFARWLNMFATRFLESVAPAQRSGLIRAVEDLARPALWKDGVWTVDYWRLRVAALKPGK